MPGIATLEGLRQYQWGKEVSGTKGTAVPATSKMAVEILDLEPEDLVDRPALAKGLLHRNPGNETIVKRGTKWTVPATPLIFDQIQNFLSMSAKGAVVASGAPSIYTWNFPVSLTADPNPDTWTIERRLSDGTNFIDNQFAYAFCSEISFEYELGKTLLFTATGFARRVQTAAITAALALPVIEIPPAPLAQMWIDGAWANLGTTLIASQITKAKVTFKSGLKPKLTFDGRSDLDFTSYVLDPKQRGIDVDLTMLVKGSAGQYATEKTAAEAASLRALRLKVLGTASRELTIDLLLKHTPGSLFKVGVDEGQDMVDMKFEDANDGTNMANFKVVNTVAAYA